MVKVACIKRRILRPSIIMVATKEDDHTIYLGRKVKVYRVGERFSLTFHDVEEKVDRAMMLEVCAYMRWFA